MPNARTTPRLRLTSETRELLRGMTEAVENGTAPFITHEAVLAARAFREIERLEAARAEAEALRKRIEELEAVLRLVYDEFVLDVARWCRHCRLRIDDHEPGCPMAEVERVLGLAGGGSQ